MSTMSASDIAGRLGLKQYSRSWRGSCPACDYQRAFTVKPGRNDRPNIYCANGCDRDALADTLQRMLGQAWKPAERPNEVDAAKARTRKQAAALRLWDGSAPVPGSLAERYLQLRGIGHLAASPALRFRADCRHPEHGCHPALIALVQDVAGEPIAVHRTYLARATGRKASIEPPKASLGPVWAGAIRLAPIRADMPLVIGEGVESSASAGRLTAWPAWAALSAGNLGRALQLPLEVRDVAIAVDPDAAGEEAARAAAVRWTGEGREVRLLRPTGRSDFNDALVLPEMRAAAVSLWTEAAWRPGDVPDTPGKAPDPRRQETASLAFRLLRMGVPGDRIVVALHEQNRRRPDPLPASVVADTALWAAQQPAWRRHAR